MPDSNVSLDEMLRRASPRKPNPEPIEVLDEDAGELGYAQMDGRYSSMRPANKSLTRVHVVKKDGTVRTYQYAFLDVLSTYDGNTFTLLFAGVKHWLITVKGHGPELWRLYDLCTLHRLPYLREAAGSMNGAVAESHTVLTEIKITDVTPRSEE